MKKVILTVDDSPSMRDMVVMTLAGAGYEALSAQDGVAALDLLAKKTVDLVITDLNMPRLDGIGLVRELRKSTRHGRIPILLLTTESGKEMRDIARSAGASGWISKPFDPAALLQVLQRLL
jgi:two-component system chemotaxis response regulator CheY